MRDRSPDYETEFLKERAARLREIATNAPLASIASQLLDVAEDLEKRAARPERAVSESTG